MSANTRLNGAIRSLEQGKPAFVTFCAPETGEKSSVPPSVPFASVSRPVNPPGSDRSLPLACAPPASSDAIAMVVVPFGGNRIWPLLVNGPSFDPPLAL